MSGFSFSAITNVKPASQVSYLKPYTINENVTIKSTEIKEGTSQDGKPWKQFVITFGNDEGIYRDSTFFLDINDPSITTRGTSDMPNGGKREMPSRWEQTYYKLSAILYTFAPDLVDKFNSAVSKCKTFDDFIKVFKAVIDKVIDKNPTNMKLVGRNSNGHTYATLPNCVGIAEAKDEKKASENNVNVGEWYTWLVTPFGNKLAFNSYEERRKNEILNAKPTEMKSDPMLDNNIDSNDSEEELDFESLL